MTYSVLQGDVLDVLPTFEAESFDAMLTDPPYGLEFMGKSWDGVVPDERVWRETLRVLKPGAFALVFGGTRTFHRLAVALEDAGFEVRDTLMWVYGSGFPKSHDVSKAIDKMAGAEREIVDQRVYAGGHVQRSTESIGYQGSNPESDRRDITAPATPEAERWQGYGTALKPAWESIILAQKPHSLTQLCGILAHKIGEAVCRLPAYVRDAERPSTCSPSAWQEAVAPDSVLWSAVERCSSLADLSATMGTWPSESAIPTSLSIALSWLDTLAALSDHASTFTTETASSLTTDLRTLNSLPWLTTPEGIIAAATTPPGTESSASLAVSIFTAARAKLLLTLGRSAHEPVTSQGDAPALRPDWRPVFLVRKPTPLTYAQNVLEHGTGALNIDGTRVPIEDGDAAQGGAKSANNRGEAVNYAGGGYDGEVRVNTEGRWPANLIHDGSDEVVSLFPRAPGQQARVGPEHGPRPSVGVYGDYGPRQDFPPRNDCGSAARFFYAAKADTAERNAGLEDRNPHPTIKPLALTEYVARLLLPPPRDTPRRILVPFAGSGSEVIGALKAGWDEAVGIEREPEYAAIAETRLAHWTKGIQLGLAFLEAV